jgi:hypothetical protein
LENSLYGSLAIGLESANGLFKLELIHLFLLLAHPRLPFLKLQVVIEAVKILHAADGRLDCGGTRPRGIMQQCGR